MKSFIQKNLPFLSILIITALILSPIILASDFADFGDFEDFSDFGDFNDFTDLGDFNDFSDFGDYQDFSDYGDYQDFTDAGDAEGPYHEPPYQPPAGDEEEQDTTDNGDNGEFDPIFDPGTEPPGTPEIPPFDEAYEATIDISLGDSPDPVQPGDELTYTITYYNRGNGDASDIVITLDTDALAPIQSSQPSATTGNYEWRLNTVESRTGGTITVKTKIKDKAEDGQTLTGTAYISYYDPVYGNKKTSDTEYTKVKAIGEPGTGPSPDDEAIGIRILSTKIPIQSATGEPVFMVMSIENSGTERLEDVKIAVVGQDIGIRTSTGPFDLAKGEEMTKTLLLDIPADVPEGNYYLRFTVTSNSQTRRVIYRDIDLVATLE